MRLANNKGYILLSAVISIGIVPCLAMMVWGTLKMNRHCQTRIDALTQYDQLQLDLLLLDLEKDLEKSKNIFCWTGILEDNGEFSTQGIIRVEGLDATAVQTPQDFLNVWRQKNINVHLNNLPKSSCLILIGNDFKLISFYKLYFTPTNSCLFERWEQESSRMVCSHQYEQKPKSNWTMRPFFRWNNQKKTIQALFPNATHEQITSRLIELPSIRS